MEFIQQISNITSMDQHKADNMITTVTNIKFNKYHYFTTRREYLHHEQLKAIELLVLYSCIFAMNDYRVQPLMHLIYSLLESAV